MLSPHWVLGIKRGKLMGELSKRPTKTVVAIDSVCSSQNLHLRLRILLLIITGLAYRVSSADIAFTVIFVRGVSSKVHLSGC